MRVSFTKFLLSLLLGSVVMVVKINYLEMLPVQRLLVNRMVVIDGGGDDGDHKDINIDSDGGNDDVDHEGGSG